MDYFLPRRSHRAGVPSTSDTIIRYNREGNAASCIMRCHLLLWFSPSDLTRGAQKGLLRAFEIRPRIETVPLDKRGFMGVQ
jgi:hypothetical protein